LHLKIKKVAEIPIDFRFLLFLNENIRKIEKIKIKRRNIYYIPYLLYFYFNKTPLKM